MIYHKMLDIWIHDQPEDSTYCREMLFVKFYTHPPCAGSVETLFYDQRSASKTVPVAANFHGHFVLGITLRTLLHGTVGDNAIVKILHK